MKYWVSLTAVGRVAPTVLMLAIGCGIDTTQLGDATELATIGDVQLALQFNDGMNVSTVSWEIDGPPDPSPDAGDWREYQRSGEIEIDRRPVASARIAGIPAGQGYTISLSYANDQMQCSGNANFAVLAGGTTPVQVNVQCTLLNANGQIEVTAPLNVCPTVALSAAPIQLEVGDTAQLWADAQDIDNGPGSLSARWTTDGGTLAPDGLQASLTCNSPSKMTVWVNVSDGDCETKAGAVIQCTDVQIIPRDWPGSPDVHTLDPMGTFTENISGATYVAGQNGAAPTLWVVQNSPSRIYRLDQKTVGTATDGWAPPSTGPWSAGKYITYPDGTGAPDSEDLTFPGTLDALYVSTERNGSGPSRLSVLRYALDDAANGDGTTLVASHEWNLTSQLPPVGSNLGLEAITWIPDSYLVDRGLLDEQTGKAYDPSMYPSHAAGLFLVGVEANGKVHAYALNHADGSATRIATFSSGQPMIMSLDFDRDTEQLWAACDDGCQGEITVLGIDTTPGSKTQGRFNAFAAFRRPAGMPNLNNEGITFAPESECVNGLKRIIWTDDTNDGGYSLRGGLMPCGQVR